MLTLHLFLKKWILAIVDFFHPLFRSVLPVQTFRYLACGGANMLLNTLIYFVSYNFILQKADVSLGALTISPHIAAYLMALMITFPVGFYLSLFVIFPGSDLQRRIQLFRYLLIAVACIFLNYLFIKLFVEYLHFYPTVSLVLSNAIVVIFSFFSQRHFSFKQTG